MAELADAQASGACGSNIVRVQVPLPALFFCLRAGWFLFYIYIPFPVIFLFLSFQCFLSDFLKLFYFLLCPLFSPSSDLLLPSPFISRHFLSYHFHYLLPFLSSFTRNHIFCYRTQITIFYVFLYFFKKVVDNFGLFLYSIFCR